MPSNDTRDRNYVKNATGIWTPVGYGTTDSTMPVTVMNSGTQAAVTPFGDLSVSLASRVIFSDSFEVVTVDVTDRWNAAGTVPATASAGVLHVEPATTASATSTLVSQPSFTILTEIDVASLVTLETTAVTGNHRFFGLGTPPSGTGTSAAPLQDAIGYEIDTAGVLRASEYSAGTRVWTQTLTYPTDGLPHILFMMLRGDYCMFYFDTVVGAPLAATQLQPQHALLPLRVASLNSGAVSGTPVFQLSGIAVLDGTGSAAAITDGNMPWRRAKVDATGAIRATQRPADLVATAVGSGGAALTLTIPAAGAGLYHYITCLSIQKYGASATAANATPLTITSTNLPGSLAWTYDTLTASGATTLRETCFPAPLKSSAANTNTTIVCPLQTGALWRVTAFYFAAP